MLRRNRAEIIGIGLCFMVAAALAFGLQKDKRMESVMQDLAGPKITSDGKPTIKKL